MKIDKIIDLVGGTKELSKLLNVSKSAVSNYKKRGGVPSYALPIIVNELKSRGLDIDFKKLTDTTDFQLNKTIVFIVTGGISAYKAPEIIRRFRDLKYRVIPVMTYGASKFITVNVNNSKNQEEAKKIAFSIANSPLVKTAIAGEDPNWGRIIMAIGKANVNINLNKLEIQFGTIKIIEKGQLSINYNEIEVAEYMKNEKIDLTINLNMGKKNFSAYTMDFTKKYIEINSDYRT